MHRPCARIDLHLRHIRHIPAGGRPLAIVSSPADDRLLRSLTLHQRFCDRICVSSASTFSSSLPLDGAAESKTKQIRANMLEDKEFQYARHLLRRDNCALSAAFQLSARVRDNPPRPIKAFIYAPTPVSLSQPFQYSLSANTLNNSSMFYGHSLPMAQGVEIEWKEANDTEASGASPAPSALHRQSVPLYWSHHPFLPASSRSGTKWPLHSSTQGRPCPLQSPLSRDLQLPARAGLVDTSLKLMSPPFFI